MKKFIITMISLSTLGISAYAASTDTVSVEQKVVEIHMTRKDGQTLEESKHRHNRTVQTMPFAGGTCSGAFIDGAGDIITARHCVEGFDSFEVLTSDQRHYTAIPVAVSKIHDLAMIHIDRQNTSYFQPATTITRGEIIYVLGSPLGITDTLSTGVIANLSGDVILLDCGVLPGNSGGPVFDSNGKLVGIINAGFIVMAGTTHLNIAQGLDAVTFFVSHVLAALYGR